MCDSKNNKRKIICLKLYDYLDKFSTERRAYSIYVKYCFNECVWKRKNKNYPKRLF